MTKPRSYLRRTLIVVPAAVLALTGLAACGDSATEETTTEATTASSETAAETTTSEASTETTEATEAATDSEVELTVTPDADLAEGDEITIDLAGLDPSYGYYVSICSTEKAPGSPAPTCTGDRTVEGTQAWLSERGTTQIPEDGALSITLTAVPTGEGVDCREDECVVKVFGDHTEGFEDVVEVPVSFAS